MTALEVEVPLRGWGQAAQGWVLAIDDCCRGRRRKCRGCRIDMQCLKELGLNSLGKPLPAEKVGDYDRDHGR